MKLLVICLTLLLSLTTSLFAEDPSPQQEGNLGRDTFKISIDLNVAFNYVFAESPNNFIVKYKMNLEGLAKNSVEDIQGNGIASAVVEGPLTRWPLGECKLDVQIGEVPFEMIFSKLSEGMVRINTKPKNDFEEVWRSNCSFQDAPGKKFSTTGNKEQWFAKALQKVESIVRDIKIPIDREHRQISTVTSPIKRFVIADPPLGSAEIDGQLVIKIIPET